MAAANTSSCCCNKRNWYEIYFEKDPTQPQCEKQEQILGKNCSLEERSFLSRPKPRVCTYNFRHGNRIRRNWKWRMAYLLTKHQSHQQRSRRRSLSAGTLHKATNRSPMWAVTVKFGTDGAIAEEVAALVRVVPKRSELYMYPRRQPQPRHRKEGLLHSD